MAKPSKSYETNLLSHTEKTKKLLAQNPTEDLRAYDFYMCATDFLSRGGKKKNESAVQMFDLALDIDPNFSLAL
ncbi:hypothetical protein GWO43_11135 [candidate division KSB1 bacterium]|nr:hypothetical protein [candidate division KSB1 bacterium]NIV69630.1 hypothetical protein [Phycisphaerae bacterium]NIR70371.1 hypothetical protein [candidate division KSB1 bacterium]NIS24494.1 hypothetical protein [candidate division KSB1 bacterium]NIT71422.1 hypothetical protein [candidate division KSB1 bacterium]